MDGTLDLTAMSGEQLAQALREAELHLEDLQEERRFTLGQTGVHLGAAKVASMRQAWDREEQSLRERIDAIKAKLAERSDGHK